MIEGREVRISNPNKLFFPEAAITKLQLVEYYLTVADAALRWIRQRPMALKRFPNGIDRPYFFQKRAPARRPDWIETIELRFPSGRSAEEVVVSDAAALAWVINLGCIDLNPHPVRVEDLAHPDELRIDLDPTPGVPWDHVRQVALMVREVLTEHGLLAFAKTSGSRGMHIAARIYPRWTFDQLRSAALALGREVERRIPSLATTRWWKEERRGVFVDYNQNAKDRTIASGYSVRPTVDARVSTPIRWEELPEVDPAQFTLHTVPNRIAAVGDPAEQLDANPNSLDSLLELSAEQKRRGEADAPWPPHYSKQEGEPPRAPPSRRRRAQ